MYLGFLRFFFFWLALQNFLLPLAYKQEWLSLATVTTIMASKEVVMILALLLLFYRFADNSWKFNWADKAGLGYCVVLVTYMLIGDQFLKQPAAPFFIKAVSLRALISPVLFYLWGRFSYLRLGELEKFIKFIVGLQFFVALFGIYEWLFLPLSFWSDTVGTGLFMLDAKGLQEGWNVVNGLPGNMVRSEIRRSISTYGDPLAMGVACVFPLLVCVAWVLWKKKTQVGSLAGLRYWAALLVIGVALLATNGRESIGVALVGILILFFQTEKSRKLLLPAAVLAGILLLIPMVWDQVVNTVTFQEGSASFHFELLQSGWKRIPDMMVGDGLGQSGTWALSLTGVHTDVGESSYLELMSQAGIASVLLLVGFLIALIKTALVYSKRTSHRLLGAAFVAMAANLIPRSIFAIFSPSLFGVIPMASFLFLCGASFTSMERAGVKKGFLLCKARVIKIARTPSISTPLSQFRLNNIDEK